jgi:hypothetical protein
MKKENRVDELRGRFLDMCPEMISKIHDLVADPSTPAATKAQLIGMVLERGMGKPETPIRVATDKEAIDNAEAELMAIVQEIQTEDEGENG